MGEEAAGSEVPREGLHNADLFNELYGELHRIAAGCFRQQPANHTLQPTALVHEAYLRISREQPALAEDRERFLCIAARVMRLVLVDYARRRTATKRGGKARRIALSEAQDTSPSTTFRDLDVLDLEEAISALERLDERMAQVVELRFFLGMTIEETAKVIDVSPKTVEKHWTGARAWLRVRLDAD